ncbi:asparagine synthase (glutamine-hydrolyzing) [uncultured Sphingomonas sp.]|uniref:asparagine synthase (glutamine-hydrolyzing) n=1 Tax=uncultured Sphingomonas sp. TaxID=158754 RepID=UPI0025E364CC|nr:asparagine synthase (glutamine-hydrolyzing) [uncultured Sphingomonas sp.]
MCGIAGFLSNRAENIPFPSIIRRMTDRIAHRGPDDAGAWADDENGIALGHRRLSILDLSSSGHQPMPSACGRYTAVYNGEIYNFRALKAEIEAVSTVTWRGHSDTEIMLAAVSLWGFEATLLKLNGMFAIALWDRQTRTLHLARDRFGEKPLYYTQKNGAFIFASELKAMQAHPSFTAEINRDALTLYLRHNYIPAPHTIWQGVFKLEPGCHLAVHADGTVEAPRPYWSFEQAALAGVAEPFVEGPHLIDELEQVLTRAVGLRMEADVPLGAFLSGGIDSSLIVALMQRQSARPVKTFTIGFSNKDFNEAEVAKAVAGHLKTEHHELYVTPDDALAIIPSLPQIWDEPFSDSSQIPTYLVSRMTRENVTVALSGDAGDELFGGYNRYFLADRIWRAIGWMPPRLRASVGHMLRAPMAGNAAQFINGLMPAARRHHAVRDRLPKLAEVLEANNHRQLYRHLVSHFSDPASLVLGGQEPKTLLDREPPDLGNPIHAMMYMDTLMYLPGDILTKVDRASMAVSLESRIPFLDPDVVDFAWRLPLSSKVRDGKGKHVLRELLYRHVPQAIIDRPKMGFGVPIDEWLRGPLLGWADDLLNADRLRKDGIFAVEPIVRMWEEHRTGKRRWHYQLWDILMFQAWYTHQTADNLTVSA